MLWCRGLGMMKVCYPGLSYDMIGCLVFAVVRLRTFYKYYSNTDSAILHDTLQSVPKSTMM